MKCAEICEDSVKFDNDVGLFSQYSSESTISTFECIKAFSQCPISESDMTLKSYQTGLITTPQASGKRPGKYRRFPTSISLTKDEFKSVPICPLPRDEPNCQDAVETRLELADLHYGEI